MKIAEVLERRREGWAELEAMCNEMKLGKFSYKANGAKLVRFSSLYRAACTDLAMSDQYQLPPSTIEYLHRLVGRAHSQLYRSTAPRLDRILQYMFLIVPHAVFLDPCVILAALLFFGSFGLSAYIAYSTPEAREHANRVLGEEQIEMMEEMHSSITRILAWTSSPSRRGGAAPACSRGRRRPPRARARRGCAWKG